MPIYLQFVRQQLVIFTGTPPFGLKTDKRITRKLLQEAKPLLHRPSPLQEALRYTEMLEEPSIVSKAQVGERFGVSRARVCQMLNLLDLDYSIQRYLLSIKDAKEHNYFTERKLRQIATIKKKHEQLKKFGEFIDELKFELNNELE